MRVSQLTCGVIAYDIGDTTSTGGIRNHEDAILLGPFVILDELLRKRYFTVHVDVIGVVLNACFTLYTCTIIRQSVSVVIDDEHSLQCIETRVRFEAPATHVPTYPRA